ncbi:malonyl-CoA-acyl carrier protein transacylase, mitochondrial-like [Saccostrea echinata]|uniref:malonyl-CoA-acyl carrier protein transacylase, mitochondrial-like n=1 Tax=Saccostrea echinata TaxID=191078 RepID=UPI002A809D78|nr:malonyl-CoA-acyl carrier protein transacylase, mitochondrial-like [Saccostrea echinata]
MKHMTMHLHYRLFRVRNVLKIKAQSIVTKNHARLVHGPTGDGGDNEPPSDTSAGADRVINEIPTEGGPPDIPSSDKPLVDPSSSLQTRGVIRKKFYVNKRFSVLLFPGQGSQFVGMGKMALHYPGVKELYEQVNEHFKKDILKLCLLGPKDELDKTINCQPAVFATSLAAVEMMKELHPEVFQNPTYTAGYSLGEITACVYAGVMSLADALNVLQTRAYAMQEASEEVGSGMMTVSITHKSKLGLAKEAAIKYCSTECGITNPVVQTASYLTPYHKVIAGHNEALDFIADTARHFGLSGCKKLSVSGAFHTTLMKPAVDDMYSAVKDATFQLKSKHRVFYNYTGKLHDNPTQIKKNLCEQLTHPIKWEQIMHTIYSRPQGEEFPQTYEVGPGRQLGYILRLTNEKAHYKKYHHIEV